MFDRLPNHIETERLSLKPTVNDDLSAVYALHKIDEVNEYLPYVTWSSYQDALDWFSRVQCRRDKQESEQYSIFLRANAKFIGSCIVFGLGSDTASAEIGYVMHPDYWGKGLMLEAMETFISSLQANIGVRSLKATVEEPNTASSGLLKKLGFALSNTSVEERGVSLQHWTKTL